MDASCANIEQVILPTKWDFELEKAGGLRPGAVAKCLKKIGVRRVYVGVTEECGKIGWLLLTTLQGV